MSLNKPDLGNGVSHPARFSDSQLLQAQRWLTEYAAGPRVLDPFAGTGRVHELSPQWETHGIEIEPEWANLHPRTQIGDALALEWTDGYFDAIVTSPTFGNRLADHHRAYDPQSRRSYAHDLGRDLHSNNSGAMQWGPAYRQFHQRAWSEAVRVLNPNHGVFILHIKNHIRKSQQQPVTEWHAQTLQDLGMILHLAVQLPGGQLRQGANGSLRCPDQMLLFTASPPSLA